MMNKTNKISKEDIKDMFGQIETPEYNPIGDIKQKINQGYTIKPRFSRTKARAICAFALVAAIFMTSVMAVYAINEYNMRKTKAFDLDGNTHDIYVADYDYDPPEDLKFFNQIVSEQESENILTLGVISEDRESVEYVWLPHKIIRDYEELQKYLDGEIFKLPQYIPDGFEFAQATITFFVDKDFDYATADLIAREDKSGDIYEQYYIPENLNNIKSISINYAKGGVQSLVYVMGLFYKEADMLTIWEDNTQSEVLQLPQFQSNTLLSTENEKTDSAFRTITYKLNATNPISIRQGYSFLTQRAILSKSKGEKFWGQSDYDMVMYDILATSLTDIDEERQNDGSLYYYVDPDGAYASRDEIIKIMESVK